MSFPNGIKIKFPGWFFHADQWLTPIFTLIKILQLIIHRWLAGLVAHPLHVTPADAYVSAERQLMLASK